ncbi:MAG TPA: ABC transporter permease [Mucilaginibacter sp.]|jgi:predicted permease|nr:ABC transporter permease [Mucilaginibacter sp.]
MIQNYFKIAWRNIVRHKGYSAINIAGLTVGIAACLLIFVVVRFELSFDTFQPGYKSTYRITSQTLRDGNIAYNAGISAPAVDAFRVRFPQAKVAGIELNYGSEVTVPAATGNPADDKKFIEDTGLMFAEPQLFDILSSQWLAGNSSALKDPNMVVLDKSSATKYFGDWHAAMGKTLRMDNLLTLKVAGILQDSRVNSAFRLKVLVSYITWKQHPKDYGYFNNWNTTSSNCQVYMRFPESVLQGTVDRQLRSFSDKQFDNKKRTGGKKYAVAQPLSAIHFDTHFGDGLGDHVTSMATLRTLSLIAVLIVIMASINFINLSTAQSVGRSKEVGIRKVLGSSRRQLIIQVIGETAIIVLISAGLASLVGEFALLFLKNIASVPDSIGLFNAGTLSCLVVVIFVVIVLSGLYPALIVSGFKPVLALKNKINAASIGGISLRRVLVVAQFAISQLLIIGTVIAIKQMDFVNNADLGFDKEAVLVVPCSNDSIGLSRINSFKQEVLALPGVKAASFASDVPSSDNNSATNFFFNHSGKDPGFDVFLKQGDADYFKTFGLRFLAGKGFDQSDSMRQVVINETLMRKLGIKRPEEALGKTFSMDKKKWVPIVGVVEDFKTNSMREEIKPTAIYPQKQYESEIGVKIEAGKLSPTVAAVQKLWETRYPEYAYTGFFLDDSIAKFYKQENQLELVYKIFALIAIFISCLGLYGLVSFMAVQRTKEVGIRKVLGASVTSIVYLFSKEFIVLIVISFAIATPAAWYLMSNWLQNFAYRIPMSAWIFATAIAASLLIGWLTVGYKAVKAALVNPVRSLRSE